MTGRISARRASGTFQHETSQKRVRKSETGVRQRVDQVPAAAGLYSTCARPGTVAVPVFRDDRPALGVVRRARERRLAHVLDLDAAGNPPPHGLDLAALLAAKVAAVHERGVRHVERVLERGVHGALHVVLADHHQVVRVVAAGNARRGDLRLGAFAPPHPDEAVRLAHRERRHGAGRRAGFSVDSPGTLRHTPLPSKRQPWYGHAMCPSESTEPCESGALRCAQRSSSAAATPRASRYRTIGRSRIVRAIGVS
jgi:hypothetical protein